MALMNFSLWYKYENVRDGIFEWYSNTNIKLRLALTKEEFENHSSR